MKNLILLLSKISKADVALAGGKGASLGEMLSAGIPVPPGFVITAQAFEQFLSDTDLAGDINAQLKKVNYHDTNSVDRYSNVIRDMIADTPFPLDLQSHIKRHFSKLGAKYVAVRSSATAEDSTTASWAGELETYLNTTDKTLINNVKKCWSSLFTPRAIFYRHEKKLLESKVSVAVVIQKMIQSEVAGICFTVHPVTKDRSQMIIEAGYGLGEAVVSGQITPDAYVINKRQMSVVDINISQQERQIKQKGISGDNKWVAVPKSQQARQKLTKPQIVKLATLCLKIEQHYGSPQDIEWALAKGRFYITQSRPITTL